MDPLSALTLLSNAVSILQGITALTNSYGQLSAIIGKRIAEGRKEWTEAERQEILDAVTSARADAVDAVGKLPNA